jgi:hypothetical protein
MRPVACLAFAVAALGWGSPVFNAAASPIRISSFSKTS